MEIKPIKWQQVYPNYYVNKESHYAVKEVNVSDAIEEKWVILDNNGRMLSCEYKENRSDCMEEADQIYFEEIEEIN